MTDNDKNTRTLIVSFVLAIMVLIPLRFVEFGQNLELMSTSVQVLGDTSVDDSLVLEEPYRSLEQAGSCYTAEEADFLTNELRQIVSSGNLPQEEMDGLVEQLVKIESGRCR